MKKLIFILLILLCMNFVSAESSFIFKQDNQVDLKIFVFNKNNSRIDTSTLCNLTVRKPDEALIVENQPMTFNSSGFFNYSIDASKINMNGEYPLCMNCDDGADFGYSCFTFEVTASGEPLSEGLGIFRIGMITILLIICLFTIYGCVKVETLFIKVLLFGLFWIILLSLSYTSWVSALNFFASNSFVAKFFYWIMIIILIASFPMILGSFVWYIYTVITIAPIRRMLDDGVPEDRAMVGKVKRDLGNFERGDRNLF